MEDKGLEPHALEIRPEVPSYILEYLEAFYILSSKRTAGFSSENPIAFSEIVSYLTLHPTDNVKLFVHLISEMDSEYMSTRSKSSGTTSKTDEPNTMSGNKF